MAITEAETTVIGSFWGQGSQAGKGAISEGTMWTASKHNLLPKTSPALSSRGLEIPAQPFFVEVIRFPGRPHLKLQSCCCRRLALCVFERICFPWRAETQRLTYWAGSNCRGTKCCYISSTLFVSRGFAEVTSKPLVLRTTLGRWGHVDHKTCLTVGNEESE